MHDVISDKKNPAVSFFSDFPMTPQQRVGTIFDMISIGHFMRLDEVIAEKDKRAVNATVTAVQTIMEFHVVPAYLEIIDLMIERGITTRRLQEHNNAEVEKFICEIPSIQFVMAKQCEESLLKIAVACGMDMSVFCESCICEAAMCALWELVPEHGHVLPGETSGWSTDLLQLYFDIAPFEAVRIALLDQVNAARSCLIDQEWGAVRSEHFGPSCVEILACTITPDDPSNG